MLTRVLSFIIPILIINTVSAQNMFRGDTNRTGIYSSREIGDNVGVKWKYKTNGILLSSPVTWNDIIYFGSADTYLYALNTDGSLLWKFKTGGEVSSTPSVSDGVIYFTSYDGYIYSLDALDGSLIWKVATGEKRRSQTGIYGFTPADVEHNDIWDVYLSSPLVVGSSVFFGSGDYYIYALNKNSGDLIWKVQTGDAVHASPSYGFNKIFCGSFDSKMYAINAETGTVEWTYQTGTDPSYFMHGIMATPAVSLTDTMIYFGSKDAYMYAVHAIS